MNPRAENAAEELLKELGADSPPVDPFDIAAALDVQVVRTQMEDSLSGMLIRDDGAPAIGVNTSHSNTRQRFTVAHEIGHLRLHRGRPLIVDSTVRVNFRDRTSAAATNREEIEANAFAAALLMPRRWVADAASTAAGVGTSALTTQLALQFNVSEPAMTFRLVNLGILAQP